MSVSRLLAVALTLAVLFAPCPGRSCFAKAQDPLPCCEGMAPGCRQIGDAAACCQNVPLSSDRGMVAAASPSPRHDDLLVNLPGPATLPTPPAFAAHVVAFGPRSAASPPQRPAVLRL